MLNGRIVLTSAVLLLLYLLYRQNITFKKIAKEAYPMRTVLTAVFFVLMAGLMACQPAWCEHKRQISEL